MLRIEPFVGEILALKERPKCSNARLCMCVRMRYLMSLYEANAMLLDLSFSGTSSSEAR